MIAASAQVAAVLPESIRKRLAELVAGKKLELPVLPEVASQVVQLCNKDQCDLRELAQLVRRDQTIAGHLMRLANSPLYAASTPLVSIDQVVSRMGLRKIRELALVITCQSKVFAVAGYEAEVRGQFRHSLAAALFAQEIARARRLNVEEAFLCGLLHDVGRPVLLQAIVDIATEQKVAVAPEAVRAASSALHERVGAELVGHWSLPVRLADAIAHHHDPSKSVSAVQQAQITALADDLAHALVGPKTLAQEAIATHPMLEPLNIYPEELDALHGKSDAIRTAVEALA